MISIGDINSNAQYWCELHQTEQRQRLNHWYSHNFAPLAVAFRHTPGHKLIVNVESFDGVDNLAERLLMYADCVAFRDTRPMKSIDAPSVAIPIDSADEDGPDYSSLNGLSAPPMIPMALPWYHTSSTTELDDGRVASYVVAMSEGHVFEDDVYDWFFKDERQLLDTGRVIYAPFIPPIDFEKEMLRQGHSLPAQFGATPLFQTVADWLDQESLTTLLRLDIPFIDGIDSETLGKIKADNHDTFSRFRSAVLTAVQGVENKAGDEGFDAEVRRIQRELIDDNVAELQTKIASVSKMRVARVSQWVVGTTALSLGALLAPELKVVAAGIGAASGSMVGFVSEMIARMKEADALKENPCYFLWRVRDAMKR